MTESLQEDPTNYLVKSVNKTDIPDQSNLIRIQHLKDEARDRQLLAPFSPDQQICLKILQRTVNQNH